MPSEIEVDLGFGEYPHSPEMFLAVNIVNTVYATDQSTTENFLRLRSNHLNSAIHTYKVAIILTDSAIKLGWDEEKVKFMAKCGLWHDIGKSEVNESLLSANKLTNEGKQEIQKDHMQKTLEIITREIENVDLRNKMLTVIMPHHSVLPNGDGSVYPRCIDIPVEKEHRTPPTPDEIEMQLLLALADKTARIMYGIHEDREPDLQRVKTELEHYKKLTDIHPKIGDLVDTIYEVIS